LKSVIFFGWKRIESTRENNLRSSGEEDKKIDLEDDGEVDQ
jgi:hypothetical protein